MIIKNPEYFLTIAQERSISKAAERLYLSQPYLSQCLSRLEGELGVKLFDRSRSPLTLTEAGRLYHSYLESVGLLTKRLETQLDELRSCRGSSLDIGVAIWRGSVLLPDILPQFSREHPGVRITLHEQPSNELMNLIREDAVDFAVVHIPGDTRELTYETIFNEKLLLAASRDHPLAASLPSTINDPQHMDIRRLEGERFILLQSSQIIGRVVDNLFARYGMTVSNAITTTSSTTAINLVSENFGFTFLPEAGIKRSANLGKLKFFTVDHPTLTIPLAIVYKRGGFISPSARAFIELTKAHYARYEREG